MKNIQFHLPIFLLLLLAGCTESELGQSADMSAIRLTAHNSQQKAIEFISAGNTDSAFVHFHKAKELYIKTGDSAQAIYSLLNLSNIYKQYNDYGEMEAANTDATRYLNNATDTIYNPGIYTNLGISYRNLHNYKKSLESYQKSLSFTRDPYRKAIVGNNMANVLIDSGALAPAQKILTKISIIDLDAKDPLTHARIIDNLGFVNYHLGDRSGMGHMEQAYALRRHHADTVGQITSLMHLAQSTVGTAPSHAIAYAATAAKLAEKIGSIDDRIEALAFIVTNASDPAQVLQFSKQHVTLSDSISTVRQRARNGFAAIKYESKSANDRVLKLEAERQLQILQQQRRALIFIIFALVLTAGSIVFILWLRIRHRREKLRESYLVETRISKKVHDELANDVYHAMTFADTQDLSAPENKETLLGSLDNIYNRTRDISSENSRIETGEKFESQLKEMMAQYHGGGTNIIANIAESVNWSKLDDIRKIAIYRVVQELLVNMKKHSSGNIAVVAISDDKNILGIRYSDNGETVSESVTLKNGLQNVENRINGINGTVTFDNNFGKGFKVNISIPI